MYQHFLGVIPRNVWLNAHLSVPAGLIPADIGGNIADDNSRNFERFEDADMPEYRIFNKMLDYDIPKYNLTCFQFL